MPGVDLRQAFIAVKPPSASSCFQTDLRSQTDAAQSLGTPSRIRALGQRTKKEHRDDVQNPGV